MKACLRPFRLLPPLLLLALASRAAPAAAADGLFILRCAGGGHTLMSSPHDGSSLASARLSVVMEKLPASRGLLKLSGASVASVLS